MKYYVYEWFRMDLNLPYYVGKGKGNRAYDVKRNTHTDVVTRYLLKNGIPREVRILAHFCTNEAALEFEKERIAFWWYLKEHDILTNQTLGGEGTSGYKLSDETKRKISVSKKGKKLSAKTCAKMSASRKGKAPHNKGKPHTDEHRKKISDSGKGRKLSDEHCAKIANALKGKPHSTERKTKISMTLKKRNALEAV